MAELLFALFIIAAGSVGWVIVDCCMEERKENLSDLNITNEQLNRIRRYSNTGVSCGEAVKSLNKIGRSGRDCE